jgi:hypothetical protein
MKNNTLMMAVGGGLLFVLGLVIGLMSGGGASVEDIDAAVASRIDAASSVEAERIAALEARLGELSTDVGGRLDQIGTGVDSSAKAVGDVGSKLGGDLEGLGQSLSTRIDTATASHLAALESGLAGLRGQISETPAAAPADGGAAEPAAQAAAPADPGTPAEGFGAGQTAILSDGAMRVFVSRVDDAGGKAHVRVNGNDMALSVGQSETFSGDGGDCRVTLDAIDRGHASVSGACGDDLPAPEGTAAGTSVQLADGLRVFVSGVTDGGVRLAVNGVATQVVPVGEAIDVAVGEQTCSVSVETVDRGRVALGYVCS